MHIVLIPDKFKGSLPAAGVRQAMQEGLRQRWPQARIQGFEASDGGDGFLDAVGAVRPLKRLTVTVSDPIGRPVPAEFGYDPSRREAFVEMARASGLVLLEDGERDALRTSTRGTGELIKAALEQGAQTVFVGLGGSATSDGGMGLATAFGYRFLDADNRELEPVGGNLDRIMRIWAPDREVLPKGTQIFAVNDVSNPLWGPDGAAPVYGPQKGASPEAVHLLNQGLRHLDTLVARHLGGQYGMEAGSGAAGGTAFGLRAFLGASFVSGTDYLFRISGFTDYLLTQQVDLILTGEGRIDTQSFQGKLLDGVLREAGKRSVPVVAVCGASELSDEQAATSGLKALLVVAHPDRPLVWNMAHAGERIREVVAANAAVWPATEW